MKRFLALIVSSSALSLFGVGCDHPIKRAEPAGSMQITTKGLLREQTDNNALRVQDMTIADGYARFAYRADGTLAESSDRRGDYSRRSDAVWSADGKSVVAGHVYSEKNELILEVSVERDGTRNILVFPETSVRGEGEIKPSSRITTWTWYRVASGNKEKWFEETTTDDGRGRPIRMLLRFYTKTSEGLEVVQSEVGVPVSSDPLRHTMVVTYYAPDGVTVAFKQHWVRQDTYQHHYMGRFVQRGNWGLEGLDVFDGGTCIRTMSLKEQNDVVSITLVTDKPFSPSAVARRYEPEQNPHDEQVQAWTEANLPRRRVVRLGALQGEFNPLDPAAARRGNEQVARDEIDVVLFQRLRDSECDEVVTRLRELLSRQRTTEDQPALRWADLAGP